MMRGQQTEVEQDAFKKLPDSVLAHIAIFAVADLPQIAVLSHAWAHICARDDVHEAKERWQAVRTRRRWLAAVRQNINALKDAPDELRGSREFMLAAMQQCFGFGSLRWYSLALEYASHELQGDRLTRLSQHLG